MFSLILKTNNLPNFIKYDETLLKLSKEKDNMKQIKEQFTILSNKLSKNQLELELQFIDNLIFEFKLNKLEVEICKAKKDILLTKLEDIIVLENTQ